MKGCERYQNLSKKKKKKCENMVINVTKISQRMRKINWLNTKKIL